jgi:CDP-paratose 2-epimerase
MNILITGAGGFIGSSAAEYFTKKNHRVIGIDNLSRSQLLGNKSIKCDQNWNYLKNTYPQIQLLKIDIRSEEQINELFQKNSFDVIIHTAGQTAIKTSIESPSEDMSNNFLGTFILLEASRRYSSKPAFLFCSTNKVYGENPNKLEMIEGSTRYFYRDSNFLGINENFPIDNTMHTPYGISKLTAEQYVQEYGFTYGLRTGVFRMSCIYGPNQMSFEDQGWLLFLIKQALKNENIRIYGNGKQVRDILYIDDLLRLYDLFILNDQLGSQVFCAGGGKQNSISIIELLQLLESKLKISIAYTIHDWREGDQKLYFSNISKAKQLLNWEPKINFKSGIDQILEKNIF